MKFRRLLLALFALAGSAAAQFTVVTGTVTDPNGLAYANGTISAGLVYPGGTSVTLSGQPYTPPSGATALDINGKFTMRLGDNTVLLPSGTTWTFLICSAAGTVQPAGGKGPVCFNVPALTISGSSQSITSNITAVPPPALSVNPGTGTLSSVSCTSPETCTPNPIVATGTISCPTCAIGPGSSTANHLAKFSGTDGLTLADGGAIPTGTVTSVATTSPIGGGTITSTGTITCTTCAIGPGSSTAGHYATFSGTDGLTLADGGGGSITFYGTCGGTAISAGTTSVGNLGLPQNGSGACSGSIGTPTIATNPAATIPHACTLKNLTLTSPTVGVNSSDSVITLYLQTSLAGAFTATALTCTVGTGRSCQDTTHTVSASAMNRIEVGIATQTGSTASAYSVAVDCQ